MNKTKLAAIGLLLLVSCSPVRGCPESNFELAPESRLPIWLPVGLEDSRADWKLELYYYAPLFDVDDTIFVLATRSGTTIQQVSGKRWYHPRTEKRLDAYYATWPRPEWPRPSYVVVEVNGHLDVIEHRGIAEQNRYWGKALFWMAKNPDIVREAIESAKVRRALQE